jgi:hypothetical protein
MSGERLRAERADELRKVRCALMGLQMRPTPHSAEQVTAVQPRQSGHRLRQCAVLDPNAMTENDLITVHWLHRLSVRTMDLWFYGKGLRRRATLSQPIKIPMS